VEHRDATLYKKWQTHRKSILIPLCALLVVIAAQRLASGFYELIWKPGGAVDLDFRYRDVHFWFEGKSLAEERTAVYPPASLAVLWPFIGWVSWPAARWLWALTTAAALAWLASFAARESGVKRFWERTAVALLPLAVYAARAVMVNGQLALHLLPPLLGGVALLDRRPSGWKRDLCVAGLFLLGSVKPTVALPFLLFLIAAKRPIRPILIFTAGYAALTAVASLFQPGSISTQLLQWYGRASREAAAMSAHAHANLQSWLGKLGLQGLNLPVSLLVLALLGLLLLLYRRSDVWIRLGMAAVVARIWSFHFRYDDMLLIVPLIAVIRLLTRDRAAGEGKGAAALIMILLGFSLLAPARLMFLARPWSSLFESTQTLIWLAALAYLAYRARREDRAAAPNAV
jgi:hypothetical protein